ncbi:MAG: glycosyltransferase family 2 protein [Gammaproteobacteria bacterium]|nr:glycosyltransferase family 2 protein [Gammaproteobacteria bacterium]
MRNQDDIIMLSVILVAYNHGPYISRALDSVLMQQTDFKFEIIIAEDFSTDDTREVIRQYQNDNPGRFRVLFREKNVGVKENVTEAEALASGKYLAILNCDDFWRDPNKLNQQVNFLENNPEFSLVYHDSNVVDESGNIVRNHQFDIRRSWTREELISGIGFATTNSALYLKLVSAERKKFNVFNGDTLRWHLLGFHGEGKYLENILPAAYRIHAGGIWSSLDHRKKFEYLLHTFSVIRKNIIDKCGVMSRELRLHDQIYYQIFSSFFFISLKDKSPKNFLYCIWQMIRVKQFRAIPIFFYSLSVIGKKLAIKTARIARIQ